MNEPVSSSHRDAPSPGREHETTDVRASSVSLAGVGLLLMIGVVILALSWVRGDFESVIARHDVAPSSVAGNQSPPEPRLQADPAADLTTWREREHRKWSAYGRIE